MASLAARKFSFSWRFLLIEFGDVSLERPDFLAQFAIVAARRLGSGFGFGLDCSRRFRQTTGGFALAVFDFLVDVVEVSVVLAVVIRHLAIAHLDDAGGHAFEKMPVVAGEDHRPLIFNERFGERFDRVDVEMVARLVENQDVVLAKQQTGQTQPGSFAAGEDRDPFFHFVAAEEQRAGQIENCLRLRAAGRVVFQIIQHGLLLGQARVDMLGIDADLATVSPTNFASQRRERVDEAPQERRLALAIVADDRRPRAVVDVEIDFAGDLPLGIADRQFAAAQGRSFARLDNRRADSGGQFIAAISANSSRSSCVCFDLARVAVLARALFFAMNSSSCLRLAITAALERSRCSRCCSAYSR